MNWTVALTAITAIFKFLNIIFTKKQEVEQKSIEGENDLKEEMHRALLAGDNSAIVLCLNRYNQLRSQTKSGN